MGFLPLPNPSYQGKRGDLVEKLQGNNNFPEQEKWKSPNSRSGYKYTPQPKCFFYLLTNKFITPTEYAIISGFWNFSELPENRKKKNIQISRAELAEYTNSSSDMAIKTINKLLRGGFIEASKRAVGVSTFYSWNVDRINEVEEYLYSGNTTPVLSKYNPLSSQNTAPVLSKYTVYIHELINNSKTSYTSFFADDHSVDNSESDSEITKVGPVGPFTSWVEMSAAMKAAVASTWHLAGYGGTFTLERIFLIIKAQRIDPTKVENVTGYLLTLLRDEGLYYELRKKFPQHFTTEEACMAHLQSLIDNTKGAEQ